MDDIDADIDELINDIKNGDKSLAQGVAELPDLNESNMADYIMRITSKIVENGFETLTCVQRDVMTHKDEKAVESYSALLNSVVSAVDTITKLNLQQMKQKAAKELKVMDIESKEKIATNKIEAGKSDGGGLLGRGSHNNILITTREDFFKMVKENSDAIDVTSESDD